MVAPYAMSVPHITLSPKTQNENNFGARTVILFQLGYWHERYMTCNGRHYGPMELQLDLRLRYHLHTPSQYRTRVGTYTIQFQTWHMTIRDISTGHRVARAGSVLSVLHTA
eukprot:3897005-Rhodomonas_salina.1